MRKYICAILLFVVAALAITAYGEAQDLQIGIAAGDIITFGTYEQDNDLSNGREPIEWIVLDVQEGKALLLSKYGLEAMQYNRKLADIAWEDSSIRAFLNKQFPRRAFTKEEQAAIITTTVDNSASQSFSEWNTGSEESTLDAVFLLSYAEANRYLGVSIDQADNIVACVAPTAYAIAQNAWTSSQQNQTAEGELAGWWWLRSPGSYQYYASSVSSDGSLGSNYICDTYLVVRPALWVNLESGFF